MMGEKFRFSSVSSSFYTPEQSERIAASTVGIAGAGGIGSNVALMLIRSGFSQLITVDFDTVAASNLNRQAYTPAHIGKPKVACLRELCRAINPDARVTPFHQRIDRTNVHRLFDNCDVIVEAFDDAASKALLFSEYLSSEKLLIGVSGIAGFGATDCIGIRQLRDRCHIVGDETTEVSETRKPYAPRVMVAAAKMADLVLTEVLEGLPAG